MIQKPTQVLKDKLQITFRLHHQLNIHQLNIDHDIIILCNVKCSLISMFILVKVESNTLILAFWHRI
jgi:hypothetical protein